MSHYESCPWCRIDRLTCWPAVHHRLPHCASTFFDTKISLKNTSSYLWVACELTDYLCTVYWSIHYKQILYIWGAHKKRWCIKQVYLTRKHPLVSSGRCNCQRVWSSLWHETPFEQKNSLLQAEAKYIPCPVLIFIGNIMRRYSNRLFIRLIYIYNSSGHDSLLWIVVMQVNVLFLAHHFKSLLKYVQSSN